MEFRTQITIPENIPCLDYQDKILLMGSCFAESIGNLLLENKFRCNVNPFGILYNPLSIAQSLRQIIDKKVYTGDDLFYFLGNYHSYMHHGSFSAPDADECLCHINNRLEEVHLQLPTLNYIFLTLGTAWIYSLKADGSIVSNCHKVPAKEFTRKRLTVEEITQEYTNLIHKVLSLNPSVRFMFTVSPIRHLKDGLHENQLSKSTLLLAVDELQKAFPEKVFYFPSYEILIDELRDYRFYADDMLHPSALAIQYIWELFADSLFSKDTKKVLKEYESIRKDINHKPFHPGSAEHKRFLEQIVLKINELRRKYPNFDVEKELQICLTRLNK